MHDGFDVRNLPSSAELAEAFAEAARSERATAYLQKVYRTGVMFDVGNHREELNETCMQMPEGQILWYMTRQLHPSVIIETGFGRGGSAAFFLTALSPWNGRLISIDPAFRHWAGKTGIIYVRELGLAENHTLVETPSEIVLAARLAEPQAPKLKLAYVDGSHHFDGTLIDFMFFDRMLEVGGVIGIDDAHAPAVRTVTSFIAHNLPYRVHYATARLVFCQKLAETQREWDHFQPFVSSPRRSWDVHPEPATPDVVPNATFAPGLR